MDRWVLALRSEASDRKGLDPYRPYSYFVEDERSAAGDVLPVATLFLTNRECPWRCVMCDLWKNTLLDTVPRGAIPTQIDHALEKLPAARHIKLYNSGSFFDHKAIPPEDYADIAGRLRPFEHVVVESHPSLVGDDCLRFRDMLSGSLEVAMGLETVHPEVLPRLNKRMTLDLFAGAAERLRQNGIALRAFILVKPPLVQEREALVWAERSVDFAFDCGADVSALIPTRPDEGALLALGECSPPSLATVEAAAAYGVGLGRGRVLADTWDLDRLSNCTQCLGLRKQRLAEQNLSQTVPAPIQCPECGGC